MHGNRTSVGANSGGQGVEPLSLRPREAAKLLGISARLLWELTKTGEIPCKRLGGRHRTVLYSVDELRKWVNRGAKGGA
jgi:excisionase family DNA binding protein